MKVAAQILVTGIVVAAGLTGFAVALPSARALLAPTGLPALLERAGLIAPEAEAAEAPGGGGRGPAAVVAEAQVLRPLVDEVVAIGTARAQRSVAMAARVEGEVIALNVASGDFVDEGTVVAEFDSAAARIARDRAVLMRDDARTNADRVGRLRATGSGTELQAQEAELALRTADLAVEEAEFDLSQHRIVAPISGWVGILAIEEGDRVSVGQELTRIEDRSRLMVDFRVPERVVSLLDVGTPLDAEALARPDVPLTGRITAIDNRVDEVSRSLRVQAAIDNPQDDLRPGQSFAVRLTFEQGSYPAVDPLAIQWGSEGAFLWAVRAGAAIRLPLRILQRDADAVLIDAALEPGDLIVTEGVQTLRVGAPVVLSGAEPAPKS